MRARCGEKEGDKGREVRRRQADDLQGVVVALKFQKLGVQLRLAWAAIPRGDACGMCKRLGQKSEAGRCSKDCASAMSTQ